MDDPAHVCLAEAARDLAKEHQCLVGREGTPRTEALGERLSVQILHRDEVHLDGRTFDEPVVEQRDDVRMLELREDARLEEEALEELRLLLVDRVGLDDLQGDGPTERRLRAVVDAPHAPTGDGPLDVELPVDDGAQQRISRAFPLDPTSVCSASVPKGHAPTSSVPWHLDGCRREGRKWRRGRHLRVTAARAVTSDVALQFRSVSPAGGGMLGVLLPPPFEPSSAPGGAWPSPPSSALDSARRSTATTRSSPSTVMIFTP